MPEYPYPLRWGIAATGGIAQQVAADLLRHPADVQLAAVASRDPERAEAFAATFGGEPLGGYAQLTTADIDIAYVATPHTDHARTSAMLLAAGIPVLCEKPLTATPTDTRELVALAERTQTFLMEAVWMRCNPLIRRAAELVAAGELGEVLFLRVAFSVSFDVPATHRLRDPKLGGGAILDLGLYPAHFIQLMLGRPVAVTARGSFDPETGVETATTALFDFAAASKHPNAQAVAYTSIRSRADQTAEVMGTGGRLVIDDFLNPTSMRLVRADGSTEVFGTTSTGNGFGHEISEVNRCVRAGLIESRLVSWASTIDVADMMHAWRAAIDRHEAQPISEG